MNEDTTNGTTTPSTDPSATPASTTPLAGSTTPEVPVLDAGSLPQAPANAPEAVIETPTPAPAPIPVAVPAAPTESVAPEAVAAAQAIPSAPMDLPVMGMGGTPETPVVGEKKKGNNMILVILLILLILGLIGFIFYMLVLRKPEVTSYADCVSAGYTVEQGTPNKCTTPDGKVYTQELPGTTQTTPTVTAATTGTATETPTVTPTTPGEATVKVFFSKDPDSYNDPTIVVSVNRSTPNADVAAFAIAELIKGPTTEEKTLKLFTELKLAGISNCGGKDFKIDIDAAKKATITFCRPIDSPGELADARIKVEIENTLNDFSTIDKTVIINSQGNCFGDLSGLNTCKS